MWDQPTEPTLVGAPVGHPDGSFGLSTGASTSNGAGLWGNPVAAGPPPSNGQGRPSSSAASAMMQQQNMPKSDVGGGPSGWGTPPKQPPPPTNGSWNAPPPQMKSGMMGGNSGVAGNGWGDSNVAQNVNGPSGWGAPASAATPGHSGPMWNGVSNSNSQWDAPSNAGATNNSWSQIASKNVQNSTRNKPNSFEPSGPAGNVGGGWGSHQVDQGTPWCNSNDSGARPKDWSSMNAGGWGDQHKDDHNAGHHHHQMGPGGGMPPPGAASWQQPPPLHHQSSMIKDANKNDAGGPYWKSGGAPTNNGPPPHVHRTGSTNGIQWGEPQHHVTSGSGWDSLPPQAHRSWNHSEPATPSNVWTGPPADSCVDSSMVWNNPNPKKVAQPDKGTNVWGDPNSQQQQEIRRWKSSDENVIQTPMANAPPGGLPQQSASTTSIWKETPTAPGGGSAKQAAAPQQTQQPNIHQSSSANWLAGSGDNKNAGQPPQQLPPQTQDLTGTSIWDSVNNKSAPTGLSGWNSAAQNDSHWGNAPKLLDNDINADDVFSTNPASLSQKNGLNANYQRMPQQNQSHLMQQHQNVKLLQNSQSMPIPQIDSQTGNKIIDQLKAAATAGLIDANLAQTLIEKSAANNRLAQETVVRMCYILQYLPKLEQAQRELQTIRNQNNPPLNEAQNQEIRRLTNEVNQYQSAVQTLKAQVNANLASLEKSSSSSAAATANDQGLARPSSSANITGEASRLLGKDPVSPQSNVSNNAVSDSLNQSKLLQWKNGNSISSNSEDSDKNKQAPVTANNSVSSSVNGSSSTTANNNNIAASPSMSNLESLVQSMATASLSGGGANDSTSLTNNDMWLNQETSNSKRETNSWPKMAGGDSTMKSDEHSRETTPSDSQNNGDLPSKEIANGLVANGSTNDESQNRMQQNIGLQGRDGLLAPIGAKNSDEGPPEFRPGQKWLWKDPKEVAEDPNATPGSIKPSSLTLNTNFNLPPLGPSLGGAFGGASLAFNNSPFGGFQSQQQQHNQQPLFGGFHSQSNNSLGLLNQQQVQQQQQHHYHGFSAMNSLFGNPSNKMNEDFKMKQQNADFFAASRMTPAPGVSRMPPSGMPNQGATGPLPFAARPPMIKPQFSMPNAFVPYAQQQQQQQWIALAITNCSQIDENHLALLVKNYGTTISYVSPPGSGMAFVKFRDVPLDRILSKMQQEFSPLGVTIQMAKESEVERLLQVFNSGASARQQQPPMPPMFGAGGPNNAAPGGPPPHHLGGGGAGSGGMLWDAPPPPVGPWGAAAASFGGPPPNLPLAPPNDPMAQLMQQQLGGDGLLGGDRHPF